VIAVLFALLMTVPLLSQERTPSTPTINVTTTYVGIGMNSAGAPPSGTRFGVIRFWDTPGTSWPAMQTASGTTLTSAGETAVKAVLSAAYSNSPGNQAVGMYTMSRTPYFATSGTSDTTCNYYNGSKWGGGSDIYSPGQCDTPSDVASDGSGTDLNWRNWITGLATFLNTLTTASHYAQVRYFEPWNEIDRSNSLTNNHATSNLSYSGTDAQLLRMTEDMRCILTGSGTIHNYPSAGSSTACSSSTWTGQSVGLIPSAKVLSPSSHAQGTSGAVATSTGVIQNFLYCSDSSLPQPDCNWGSGKNWGSSAVDIINFHMKPGNEAQTGSATDPETEMATEYSNATTFLDSTDVAKPFWNGEAGYSGNGWTPASGGDVDLTPYPDQQAAFVARYMLVQWSLGIQSFNWYQWDNSNFLNGTNTGTYGSYLDPGKAYSEVSNWMVGRKMSSSGCAVVTGTLWSCTFTLGTWTGEAFWDTSSSHECEVTGGGCTTYSYNVPATHSWTLTRTALGVQTSISSPYTIQVSNLPVIIMTGSL
jgi:hypothetical protein